MGSLLVVVRGRRTAWKLHEIMINCCACTGCSCGRGTCDKAQRSTTRADAARRDREKEAEAERDLEIEREQEELRGVLEDVCSACSGSGDGTRAPLLPHK